MDEYKDRGLTSYWVGIFSVFSSNHVRGRTFRFGRHKWKTRKEAVKESCDKNYESIIPNVSGTAITTVFKKYIYI